MLLRDAAQSGTAADRWSLRANELVLQRAMAQTKHIFLVHQTCVRVSGRRRGVLKKWGTAADGSPLRVCSIVLQRISWDRIGCICIQYMTLTKYQQLRGSNQKRSVKWCQWGTYDQWSETKACRRRPVFCLCVSAQCLTRGWVGCSFALLGLP